MRSALHAFGLFVLVIILTQDYQVFAERIHQLAGSPRPFVPPPDGEAADGFVRTGDGEWIHFRRWQGLGSPKTGYRVAILHHGNAGTMDGYRTVPRWLASLGVTSYVYDYRGYGLSTGTPSERGIYRDADAVFEQAVRNESTGADEVLSFAHSLGGGPASHLAANRKLGALILAGTYTSVPEQARTNPIFGWLSRYVWTEFPNEAHVRRLDRTCLIVLHGGRDNAMPRWMSLRLAESYAGRGGVFFAESANATHDSIVTEAPGLAGPLLARCVKN